MIAQAAEFANGTDAHDGGFEISGCQNTAHTSQILLSILCWSQFEVAGLSAHELQAVLITAVFAGVFAVGACRFAAFRQAAHRFPCCAALAAFTAVWA